MTAPKAMAYDHLGSAAAEDGDSTYDADGVVNGIVVWHGPDGSGEDHILTADYVIESGYTLNIPALDYITNPVGQSVIYFDPPTAIPLKMQVFGTLITNPGIYKFRMEFNYFDPTGAETWAECTIVVEVFPEIQ